MRNEVSQCCGVKQNNKEPRTCFYGSIQCLCIIHRLRIHIIPIQNVHLFQDIQNMYHKIVT